MSDMIPWLIAMLALGATGLLWQQLRRTEADLHTSRQEVGARCDAEIQYREALLNLVDDAYLVLDSDQRILYANPAAEMLLGQTSLAGQKLNTVFSHNELDLLLQDARMVGGEGVERRIEHGLKIVHAHAILLTRPDGDVVEVLMLRDVTQIQRLERARREMVSNVSHELSTPITTIGLLADTLLNGIIKEKPKKSRKMVADIRREVETLTQLVQEMRDLSLIESGQMPVRLMPTDLSEIVNASVEPLLALAENKQQAVTIDLAPGVSVLADGAQIQRAIKNIVHNAIKYTPNAGAIQVSTSTTGEEAIIAVQDTGPGIPAEDLPRVFERFFQVDRARSNGTGLGLAIVRHITLAHGGRAWAESAAGQGATFFVALPLSDTPPAAHS
ncbi:MAG: PAS domain S-box protein [Chloroflexi bacterium]|nr:PAS domain S-box protein [Chloroflexota bacterium]